MYLLGYDIGTSSIKATLMDCQSQRAVASAGSPKKEMEILADQPGFAEQHPELWWENVKAATAELLEKSGAEAGDIQAIGITYQMHGLVAVDANLQVLRPAIIWCDSRAVEIGKKAAADIGEQKCLKSLLNLPGNFTAGKLKWVKDNQPDIYKRIHKIMLPGDYIAMKLTGEVRTTETGLSEGIFWDFNENKVSPLLREYYGFDEGLFPETAPTFGAQGELTRQAAEQLGLKAGTPVTYRAGDQPNNAFSLNVLEPGQVAATAGTSGVVYGITDKASYDEQSRVNNFIHVNHSHERPRIGVLLCVNGTGILNSWLKHNVVEPGEDYEQMNHLAASVPPGAEGLFVLPYGNGAERTLGNANIDASVHRMNFNTHTKAHLLRAAQEGIVFALNYGLEIMTGMGVKVQTVRAGHANMFMSELFASAFAAVTGAVVELYDTDGSQGAARGAGVGADVYKDLTQAFTHLDIVRTIEPDTELAKQYKQIYLGWASILTERLK